MSQILLVEDNLSLCEVIIRDLKNHGFQVEAVHAGLDALEKLTSQSYDAVILDWMLPDIDGLEVLRRLQASQTSTPVLMLTARAEETDRVIGLEGGADDYLTKPFSMRELVACLHALLRRVEITRQMFVREANPEEPALLNWQDLFIEPDSRRVSAAGQEFDLTPIEFALLVLFVRHPGRVFNRAFLMETVWQQSYLPGDRSVDNAVMRLRKKIYPHGETIEAVWGVGYRLRKP